MRASFLHRRLGSIMVAGVVSCALALAWSGGVLAWERSGAPRVVAAKDQPQSPAQLAVELMKPGPLPELALGRDDAPVTIVEYADLTCPHCAAFHSKVLPLVKGRYIDTGKARLIFREFPLNIHSLIAFMSLRCVAPQEAFPLLDVLFSHQDDWSQSRSTKELADKLFALGRQAGQQAGLTRETFDGCVPSHDKLSTDRQKQLFKDIATVGDHAGQAFGVDSTPTFFVNGKKLSGATIEDFDKAIGAALSR